MKNHVCVCVCVRVSAVLTGKAKVVFVQPEQFFDRRQRYWTRGEIIVQMESQPKFKNVTKLVPVATEADKTSMSQS